MIQAFCDTYELISIIGKGGMSTVYLAEHKRLHTKWAVKEVRKQQAAQVDFLAESNLLKRLRHPMLPRIVDIFEDDRTILIVEDYVEGLTVEALLRDRQRVDEERALAWFRDLCGVLGYLHSQQPNPIIYRDMKPSNIMVQPDGSIKLIDFGIAREYKRDSSADTTYIGTKGYAAPEQFGTAQSDARTDIYSLGVTMYHILTGKSPYDPPYQFVPARELLPSLSRGIEYILGKCIQSEPEARYQTIQELLFDLDHIYRFDDAWKKVQAVRRLRVGLVAVLFVASVGMMAGGRLLMGREKEDRWSELLAQAGVQLAADPAGALPLLEEARQLYPQRVEPDRQQTYALYLAGEWEECISYGQQTLERFGPDPQTRLAMASAQFELEEYEQAAEGFAQGGDLSADHLRDYAVCLGRLGDTAEAERILQQLVGQGAQPDMTQYVQGEVCLARQEYLQAEQLFLQVLEREPEMPLLRRCYLSLGTLYRQCAALAYTGASPIEKPAEKSIALLSTAVALDGLGYDNLLWETLGLACYEAYRSADPPQPEYLTQAASCFDRVLRQGVAKEYLYANLYTIYYELRDYAAAEQALVGYEEAFPADHTPHALRGLLLITQQNELPQESRDYSAALAEYEQAGKMLRSTDDTSYYQQLGSLIEGLRQNGWL